MSQRVQSDLNPWLWICATHLGVAGRRARILSQLSPTHTRSNRVTGCSGQLVRPSCPRPRNRHRIPGRRAAAGSDGQSELDSSSAFLFLTRSCGESQEDRASPPTPLLRSKAEALVALALEATRALFFFPAATAFLSFRRITGENSMLEIALIRLTPASALRLQQEFTFLLSILCSAGGIVVTAV